jgi:DNA-binding response OmpR family regulator
MTQPRKRVLVVDDELPIAEVVGTYLRLAGYEPLCVASGGEALEMFDGIQPCLVILDLMLPDLSGEEVCRRLRARSRVPIIMLTAKVEEADAQRGLELGADDYVTKPFSPRLLMARVEAVLRRTSSDSLPLAGRLRFAEGELEIDVGLSEVRRRGNPVSLTPREFRLLRVLASNPGRVFSREELIRRAMGDDFDGFDRTIDAHIKNLRQKVEPDPRQPRFIRTVHGLGYRFSSDQSP